MYQSIETPTSPPRARVGNSGGMDARLNKIVAQRGGVMDNYWTEKDKVHNLIKFTKWKDKD